MRRTYVLVLAMLTLSACGSPEKAAPEVATLASAAPATSASPKAERPRERLDGSPEDFEALLGPYNKCLKEHGALPKAEWYPNGKTPDRKTIVKLAEKNEQADRICGPLYYPLPPWERDPANPEAKDFSRAVLKCLKGKGIKGASIGDNGVDIDLGGTPTNPGDVPKALDLMPGCERQAAAGLKK
jgi:hypothetical protein